MKRDRISGFQAEDWFIKFAAQTNLKDSERFNLESLIKLLDRELPKRLENGILKDESGKFPDGLVWVQRVLQGQSLNLSDEVKQKYAKHLLDQSTSTDAVIQMPGLNGVERIAIDITINPLKEASKLVKIQGQPESYEAPGENRNKNIAKVREKLGITKHLVLILKGDRTQLPSYQHLKDQLTNFAQSQESTGLINLHELSPENTVIGDYQALGEPHQDKVAQQRLEAIAEDSIARGDHAKYTAQLLRLDASIRTLKSPENIQKVPEQIADKAREKTADAKIVARIKTVLSQVRSQRGKKEFKAGQLTFAQSGEIYSITDAKRGEVFKANSFQTVSNNLTPEEQERFSGIKLKPQPSPKTHPLPDKAFRVIQTALDTVATTQPESLAEYMEKQGMEGDNIRELFAAFGLDAEQYGESAAIIENTITEDVQELSRELSESEFQVVRAVLDAYAIEHTSDMAMILAQSHTTPEIESLFESYNLNVHEYDSELETESSEDLEA